MLEATQTSAASERFTWTRTKGIVRTVVQTLLWFFAAAVLVQNLMLQKQNKGLKDAQATMVPKETYFQAIAPPVDLGRHLQVVAGVTLDGNFREIQLAAGQSRGTVIITFSPGCINCVHNQDKWYSLVGGLKSQGWQVVWVSRDPRDVTLRYCRSHSINISEVIADPTYQTYFRLGLAAVPNTVAVDTHGTVQHVWAGKLSDNSWRDMFAYFQLSLPSSPFASEHTTTK